MQVQVSTDKNIDGREALERWAETELAEKLAHFRADITRIEVHLSENSKKGEEDRQCVMEARMAAHQPIAVSHHAPGVDEAFRGALAKLKHALDSTTGRDKTHRDRESIRRDIEAPTA
jgi:hypothetical protein